VDWEERARCADGRSAVSWAEFWNRETTIYVSARHKRVHYALIARDLLRYVPDPGARVVDYGCGDTLGAAEVAARCGHLFLCESAETVRERLAARYADSANVSVISPEQFAGLEPGTIDTIVVNSVIQYLSLQDFQRLLAVAREKLTGGGRLVLGDVIPRHVGPMGDAAELMKLAAANGFLLAAGLGLVRSALSSYPRVRRELGFLQFEATALLAELARAGLAGRREPRNIGHSTARMTFVATRHEGLAQPDADDRRDAATDRHEEAGQAPLHAPRAWAGERAGYGLATGLFAGLWALLCYPWLSGAVTIPYDAKALFQAQLQFLANALHSGQSPFWNPSAFVGVPQIADPQSLILSPAILLAVLDKAPSFRLLDAYVLALLAIGGLAVLKLFQDRRWHPAGGVVAALAFAFGASAAWRIQHIAQIQSLALFGVTLWLLARALDRSSVRCGVLAGVAAGLMVVEPNQVALLGGYILAGYCVHHWLSTADRRLALRASLRPLAACGLVTLSLAALPVLLTYLFLDGSNRPGIAFAEAVRGSLHPASLLTGLIADLFGAFDPAVHYWGPYSESWDKKIELTVTQNMSQVYVGTLPMLLLLAVGLVRGALWSRELRFYAIALAALLLYALGGFTPVFGVFFDYLPGVALFRRPVDATFLIGALLAIAAGYLVHLWASGALPIATVRRRAAEAALILAILLGGLATAWSVDRIAFAMKPLLLTVGWIAAALILLAVPLAWRKTRPALAVAAPALLLAGDLLLNNGPNESTALPPAAYEVLKLECRNETVRFLKAQMRRTVGSQWRDRVEIAGLGFEWQNAALVHGLEGTLGYNPFRLAEVAAATGARDYIAGSDQKAFAPLFPSYASPMANLLGLRFIATGVPVEQIDPRLKPGDLRLVARTGDAFVYENPGALPRVLFVGAWQQADFEVLTASGEWPTFDPTRTVLLEEAPTPDSPAEPPGEPVVAQQVVIRHYENTKVVVEVDAPHAGFVVLNDVWHPWWTADLDGEDVPILRANVLFRAVHVAAGRHVLTFEFKPISSAMEEIGERLTGSSG
jgi:SAM-dependent methyltransferase